MKTIKIDKERLKREMDGCGYYEDARVKCVYGSTRPSATFCLYRCNQRKGTFIDV